MGFSGGAGGEDKRALKAEGRQDHQPREQFRDLQFLPGSAGASQQFELGNRRGVEASTFEPGPDAGGVQSLPAYPSRFA
jgi:hypothetical protein